MANWNDYYVRGNSSSYEDYYFTENYRLPKYTNPKDDYVLILKNGVNWRFAPRVPEKVVNRAHELAKKKFSNMVEDLDTNPTSRIRNIRIRKNVTQLTEEEKNDFLVQIAELNEMLRSNQ